MHRDDPQLPQQATAEELERASEAGVSEDEGALRARISNAMVGLKKEFYGKGPVAAKTFFNDDYVFVALEGGLTRNEETLLAAGEYRLVREVRLRFQEAMTETICGAIEEILERRVLTYNSQIMFDPTRTFEIFVLQPR
jgi:uncharacterized protein YbcI